MLTTDICWRERLQCQGNVFLEQQHLICSDQPTHFPPAPILLLHRRQSLLVNTCSCHDISQHSDIFTSVSHNSHPELCPVCWRLVSNILCCSNFNKSKLPGLLSSTISVLGAKSDLQQVWEEPFKTHA